MSHQVKQVGRIVMTDVNLLKRAVAALSQQQLGLAFSLALDENNKKAQYYAGNFDDCDMVIGASRKLSDSERGSFYDIAVKIQDAVDDQKRPCKQLALFADTHGSDRGMSKRIDLIMQRYLVEKRRAEHIENGAVEVTETTNAKGQVTVSGTYMKE